MRPSGAEVTQQCRRCFHVGYNRVRHRVEQACVHHGVRVAVTGTHGPQGQLVRPEQLSKSGLGRFCTKLNQ